MMPFGDGSMLSIPPIRGEFTNLLLQTDYKVSVSRHLDFGE
jgi:hypothetical protein